MLIDTKGDEEKKRKALEITGREFDRKREEK